MARTIIRYGKWYIAYEIGSSVLVLAAAWGSGLSPL